MDKTSRELHLPITYRREVRTVLARTIPYIATVVHLVNIVCMYLIGLYLMCFSSVNVVENHSEKFLSARFIRPHSRCLPETTLRDRA